MNGRVSFPLLALVTVLVAVVVSAIDGTTSGHDATSLSANSSPRPRGTAAKVVWPTTKAEVVGLRKLSKNRWTYKRGLNTTVPTTTARAATTVEHRPPNRKGVAAGFGPAEEVQNRFLVIPQNRCAAGKIRSSNGECIDEFQEDR